MAKQKATVTLTLERNEDEALPDDGDSGDTSDGDQGVVVVFTQAGDEQSLEDVEVSLTGNGVDRVESSGSSSAVSFDNVPIQAYEVRAEKQGYHDASQFIYKSSFKEQSD